MPSGMGCSLYQYRSALMISLFSVPGTNNVIIWRDFTSKWLNTRQRISTMMNQNLWLFTTGLSLHNPSCCGPLFIAGMDMLYCKYVTLGILENNKHMWGRSYQVNPLKIRLETSQENNFIRCVSHMRHKKTSED